MQFTKKELKTILEKHEKWVKNEEGGERANLKWADLKGADLYEANLIEADLRGADLTRANLINADLRDTDLRGADLYEANLIDADLRRANLRGANLYEADLLYANLACADLDFSCLTLSCKSLATHFDDRQLRQIAYHLVKAGLNSKNASLETKAELHKLIDFANGFHRVKECGEIIPDKSAIKGVAADGD